MYHGLRVSVSHILCAVVLSFEIQHQGSSTTVVVRPDETIATELEELDEGPYIGITVGTAWFPKSNTWEKAGLVDYIGTCTHTTTLPIKQKEPTKTYTQLLPVVTAR
jgi:hypothetical protein